MKRTEVGFTVNNMGNTYFDNFVEETSTLLKLPKKNAITNNYKIGIIYVSKALGLN